MTLHMERVSLLGLPLFMFFAVRLVCLMCLRWSSG